MALFSGNVIIDKEFLKLLIPRNLSNNSLYKLPVKLNGYKDRESLVNGNVNEVTGILKSPNRRLRHSVRFKDVFGAPLVETYLFNQKSESLKPPVSKNQSSPSTLIVCPGFVLNKIDQWLALANNHVALMECTIINRLISGIVAVHNLAYEKEVTVRHTEDGWLTFEDTPSNYMIGSSVRPVPPQEYGIDYFAFSICLRSSLQIGLPIALSICYTVNDQQYWDNNDNMNYNFDVITEIKNCNSDPTFAAFI